MTAFWAITPMKEAVRTSETSVYFNETTQHYSPEDCYVRSRENYFVSNMSYWRIEHIGPNYNSLETISDGRPVLNLTLFFVAEV
jgi:hypothetical protein